MSSATNLKSPGIDLSANGIALNSSEYKSFSQHIQGNILKSHGRSHTSSIFFRFKDEAQAQAKLFIRDISREGVVPVSGIKQGTMSARVISAFQQDEDALQFKSNGEQRLFTGIYFSAKGYEFLGLAKPSERIFDAGMASSLSKDLLNDPPSEKWETPFQVEIHGMILLATGGSTRTKLDIETANVVAALNTVATDVFVEIGDGIKNENGANIEHFGYVDGISQPRFFKEDFTNPKQIDVNRERWDPAMPADIVLVKDPGSDHEDAYGSYLVFRKLEQNVLAFKIAEKNLAAALQLEEPELAGALIVGRFENGVPVTLSDNDFADFGSLTNQAGLGLYNNFNYLTDPHGAKCPFHAHIRKTNPRGDTTNLEDEKKRMMARRGILYGKRDRYMQDMPKGGIGLLFMSFQASIEQQFAFIQQNWVNDNKFAKHGSGRDPIIGQGDITTGLHCYARVHGNPDSITSVPAMGDFVTMKGGEYFFAPSMDTLRQIIVEEDT